MKTFPAKPREASDNLMNDNRGARSRARQIKKELSGLPNVKQVDIMRASNQVGFNYGKDVFEHVDELMFSLDLRVETDISIETDSSNRENLDLEEKLLNQKTAKIVSDLYENAQIHSLIDWQYPEDDGYYNVRLWVQECNSTQLAIRKDHEHKFYDLQGQELWHLFDSPEEAGA